MIYFLWLVKHGRIMSNEERKKIGFIMNDYCHKCQGVREDVDHILRKCPLSKEVWKEILLAGSFNSRWWCDFPTWLNVNIAGKGPGKTLGDGAAVFTIVTWWLWKWRNESVFSGRIQSIDQKAHWIKTQCTGISKAFTKALKPASSHRTEETRLLKWQKPESGWFKVNTDGLIHKIKQRAECGSLIKYDNGA